MSELEVEAQGEPRDSSKKKKKKKKEKRRVSEEDEEEEEERKQEEEKKEKEKEKKEKEKSESVLMRGIFKVGKKSHDVLLTHTRLTWTPIIPESPTGEGSVPQAGEVLLQDVFAVKVKRRRMAGQQSGGAVLGLALFHSRRRGRRLEEDTLHLHNASAEHTHSWYNTLKEQLTGGASVFVNSIQQLSFKSCVGNSTLILDNIEIVYHGNGLENQSNMLLTETERRLLRNTSELNRIDS